MNQAQKRGRGGLGWAGMGVGEQRRRGLSILYIPFFTFFFFSVVLQSLSFSSSFPTSAPTNVVNMAVFFRQGLRERINLCLFCLSLADLIYMLHSFLFNVDRLYQQVAHIPSGFGPVFEFIVNNHLMGFRGFSWVSGMITTVIACERCFCVLSPLRSQTVIKTRTAAIFLLLASLGVLAILFITTTRWSLACVYDPVSNSTSRTIYSRKFYRENKEFVDTLTGYVVSLALPALYIGVVSTSTAITLVKLRKVAAWREQTSSATMSSREVALTRMLVGIAVLYVICLMPVLALGVAILSVSEFSLHGRYYNIFNLMVSIFELFSYINSSVNFFVYCFLGSRFKETLREMFKCGILVKMIKTNTAGAKTDSTSDTTQT